ncbi:helix-turn-helix protein [Micromonospora pisi]|uniref:Helix-turn-helix protein n=1 Tax=Micromonospora pisi TaxID=589240 RepID=A0A495JND1_9ACTN|nr:helix-turn-helix transcriptional regulator [Micromonospora pisi]RKR90331.1 helix-turn-helix protein [Micromonospora pisi]
MVVGSPPTVRRRQLGRELRKLREAAGFKAEQVALEVRCSPSRVSRIETARVRITPGTVHELLDVYRVEGAERQRLVALARQAQEAGWWQAHSDSLTWEYSTLIALEHDATELRTFESSVLPGLLQTEEYARTVLRKTLLEQIPDSTEEKLVVRLARQRILSRPQDPVRLWAILDEAVLRRQVGGPDVMGPQLRHLVEMADRPNVQLQVLPFARGAYACNTGPFLLLSFADGAEGEGPVDEPVDGDVVYVENEAGDIYVEKEPGVARYRMVFDNLRVDALSCAESRSWLADLAAELP